MTLITALKALIGIQPESEVSRERRRLQSILEPIAALELRNQYAREASRLEQLRAAGVPFYQSEQAAPSPPRRHKVKVPVYTEGRGGYRYEQTFAELEQVRREQDPLFGWEISIQDWLDLGSAWPVSAFPREMFPERPTTLRTQIAQDAIRFQSRIWFEQLPQYYGPIGHLRNYIVGSGMTIDCVVKDNKKDEPKYEQQPEGEPAEESESETQDPNEGLAEDIQAYIDGFAEQRAMPNGRRVCRGLHHRLQDSVLNLFRDGEDALRLEPGDEYPKLRSVDVSAIRGPHNEITGPWAYGVLTSWPRDYEDVQAYHVWYADNTHEDVSPNELHICKLQTTGANVKRGVPLCYAIRKQLPQMERLLDCMAIGEAARQAIPYLVQYNLADKSAIRMATPSALEAYDALHNEWEDGRHRRGGIEAGQVQHISRGMEFQDTPQGRAESGAMAYRTLCEAIAGALNVPVWWVTGSADSENFASSEVSNTPKTLLIQNYQKIITDHYEAVCSSCVDMSGKFPEDWREKCEIHCELPSPLARDPDKAVDSDLKLLDKKLLSPQHVCVRNGLDWDEETDLIAQAEEAGWENSIDQLPNEGMPADGDKQPPGESANG